ncbi:MAG: ankyrin repeat domain-containing protein [Geminicoccaceae bacterium]
MKTIACSLVRIGSPILFMMTTMSCGEFVADATFCAAGGEPLWCGVGRRSLEEKMEESSADSFFKRPIDAALAESTAQGDLNQMEALIDQGANVNAKGADGVDMLYWSYVSGSKGSFAKLLQHGANPLRDPPSRKAIAFEAARDDDPGYLEILLEQGLEPNTTIKQGARATLLMEAAKTGHMQQVNLLMEYCADLNWTDGEFGHNAAKAAATFRHWDIVIRLLEAGYSYDLQRLGWIVDADFQRMSSAASPEIREQLSTLVGMLEERGLVFPLYDGSPAPRAAPPRGSAYAAECKNLPDEMTQRQHQSGYGPSSRSPSARRFRIVIRARRRCSLRSWRRWQR